MQLIILVIEAGFVYIGEAKPFKCPLLGKAIELTNAYNVHRFGTTEGLGELANVGRTATTVLNFSGAIIVPIGKILHYMPVEPKARESYGF